MKVEFHSLYWDNIAPELINAHKMVMAHFGIDMKYTAKNIEHCHWLDSVLRNAKSDVVAIIEPDCIPLSRESLDNYINYAFERETFVGHAQVANQFAPTVHVYASPAMFIISMKCYKRMGSPSFQHTLFYDVGELISYKAESLGIPYKALMPNCFEKMPTTGIAWRIGALAVYGIGTVFDNSIYHLFESRKSLNVDLFVKRCNEVVNGTFSCEGFMPSNLLNLPEIAKPLGSQKLLWRLRRLYHFIKNKIVDF